ncbi:MAG: HNH endonuclease family protein, partial [Firmicutes bacterium]|nr:HNH endonuclease family protein [Bacillota bacterium]
DKSTIFDEASNAIVTKTKFQESLDELIAKSIDFKKDYCELNYSNPNDYNDIKKILLLFNVETIRQKNDDSMRFSFSKHKKQNWSLEHIHAQVSEGLSKNEQWIEWLQLHKKSLLSIDANENTNLIQEIELAEKNDKLTGEQFSLLSQKIIKILSEEGSTDYLHTLSNMALLEQSKNSALSNSTFDVKRNKIIEIDKTGEYLPICTRMVFLKYYTPSEFNQLHFWGENDRKAYISEMNKVLKNYLSIINKKITI